MNLFRPLAVAAFAVLSACSMMPGKKAEAPKPGVTGNWVLTVESPMGTRDSDAVFTQSGEQLSGKIVSARGEAPLTNGSVKGDAIAFSININAQGTDLQIDYSGTVTGDTMGGTVQFGSFGDGKWTGKRKAAAAAP
jgi:hypothetical protein